MENSFVQIFFRNTHHIPLLLALAAGIIGAFLVYRSTDPQTTVLRRVVMAVLRSIAIAAAVFMLADPLLLAHHREEITPSVAILLDNSKSITISDKSGDRRKKLLSIAYSDDFKNIEKKYPVYRFTFSDSLRINGELKFDGNSTALGEALSELLDTASSLELGAVVVVSDGQNNVGIDPLSIAGTYPFPIFTIGVGASEPAPDVAVSQVLANPVSYANEKMPVIAYIRSWRISGKQTEVSIWEGNRKLGRQKIELPKSGQVIPVKFEITPEKAGTHYYTVRIPKLGGEISSSNNAQSVAVKVLPSRKRVLIASDHASWEVSFWRRALEEDPHIEISLFIDRGGGDAKFNRFPSDTSTLNQFDAVVLVYFSEAMTPFVANALEQYVRGGGSLLWLFDDGTISSQSLKNIEPALPVQFDSGMKFVSEQFVPVVSADGFTHPIMKITRSGEDLASAIAGMPPVFGAVPSTSKPEAKILLVHPEKDIPILAVWEYGSGRSAVICGAPLWRWAIIPAGFGGDDHIFKNLAQNLLKFLLAKEKISRFVLRPGKRVYRSGEPITISASLRDESNQPLSGAKISIDVKPVDSDTASSFTIEPTEIGNGIYQSRLPSLSPGKYRISGTASFGDRKIGSARTSIVVEEYQLEFAQSNQDRAMLEGIAQLSGGKYFSADSISNLPDEIKIRKRMRTWTSEKELWSSMWLMFIIVLSLAIEWILRKRANLL